MSRVGWSDQDERIAQAVRDADARLLGAFSREALERWFSVNCAVCAQGLASHECVRLSVLIHPHGEVPGIVCAHCNNRAIQHAVGMSSREGS